MCLISSKPWIWSQVFSWWDMKHLPEGVLKVSRPDAQTASSGSLIFRGATTPLRIEFLQQLTPNQERTVITIYDWGPKPLISATSHLAVNCPVIAEGFHTMKPNWKLFGSSFWQQSLDIKVMNRTGEPFITSSKVGIKTWVCLVALW